jgi:hypothetical protein
MANAWICQHQPPQIHGAIYNNDRKRNAEEGMTRRQNMLEGRNLHLEFDAFQSGLGLLVVFVAFAKHRGV